MIVQGGFTPLYSDPNRFKGVIVSWDQRDKQQPQFFQREIRAFKYNTKGQTLCFLPFSILLIDFLKVRCFLKVKVERKYLIVRRFRNQMSIIKIIFDLDLKKEKKN